MNAPVFIEFERLDPDIPADETRDKATITRLQEELTLRLLYHGPIDGAYNPMLETAIGIYQEHNGLARNGRPSDALLAHMLNSKMPELWLIDDAVNLVREAGRGNGLKPEEVTFNGFQGGELFFETTQIFTVEARTGEKFLHGKEHGEGAGSLQDARDKIHKEKVKITLNTAVRHQTIDMLKHMRDLGFGSDALSVSLDRLNKTFVVHEVCSTCAGKTHTACPACHGNGKTPCPKCHGSRNMLCPACRGSQFVNDAKGRHPCRRCQGRGKAPCDKCKRTGAVLCPACRQKGQMPCKGCSGTGWHSHMFYLELLAKSRFYYDKEALPPELPPLLDTLRGAVVTEGHAQVTLVEDSKREKELAQAGKTEEYWVPYEVRLPWGAIGFKIKGEDVAGTLFGRRPLLVNMPPFLENLIAPGLRALESAAKPGASAVTKLREAARYRLLAEAIAASARQSQRKTFDQLHKRYPFGITNEKLLQITAQCVQALKGVTKSARISGLVAGLTVAGALDALFYLGPVRAMVAAALPNPVLLITIDAALMLAGCAATTASIKHAAQRALHRALGPLMRGEGKQKKPAPRAGQIALAGWLGCAVIDLIIMELAAHTGGGAPEWYQHLRHVAGL